MNKPRQYGRQPKPGELPIPTPGQRIEKNQPGNPNRQDQNAASVRKALNQAYGGKVTFNE